MTYVFLIIFSLARVQNGGGPAMSVTQMPTRTACETVGASMKKLNEDYTRKWAETYYWCIETK